MQRYVGHQGKYLQMEAKLGNIKHRAKSFREIVLNEHVQCHVISIAANQ